mgnify:CR=1 FL=1
MQYVKWEFKLENNLDVDSEVVLDAKIGMGSDDLTGVYKTSGVLANDTSFGVGYAPYSITDQLTLKTEQYINGAMKKKLPETGQDVKVIEYEDELTFYVLQRQDNGDFPRDCGFL